MAGSGGPRQHVDSCSKSGEEDNQQSRVKQDIDGLVDYCGVVLYFSQVGRILTAEDVEKEED